MLMDRFQTDPFRQEPDHLEGVMCAIFRYNYTEVYVPLALRIHYATKVESQ